MRKEQLKPGMLVETRSKGNYLVVSNVLLGTNGYMTLSSYDEELKLQEPHVEEGSYDIMRVTVVLEGYKLQVKFWGREETITDHCIWERNTDTIDWDSNPLVIREDSSGPIVLRVVEAANSINKWFKGVVVNEGNALYNNGEILDLYKENFKLKE